MDFSRGSLNSSNAETVELRKTNLKNESNFIRLLTEFEDEIRGQSIAEPEFELEEKNH